LRKSPVGRAFGVVASCAALLLAACSSRGPLYSQDDPPRLLDGEIRMTSTWQAGGEPVPDVREIKCRDGRVTATYDGRLGRREGEAPTAAWERLWNRIADAAPWNSPRFTVEPDDPKAGPYHVVTLRIGDRSSAFSSQLAGGFIQLGTQSGSARMSHSNAVAEFVTTYATRETRKEAASRPAAGAESRAALLDPLNPPPVKKK
jgi:hypothetical protein